jgi:hypothetical protein
MRPRLAIIADVVGQASANCKRRPSPEIGGGRRMMHPAAGKLKSGSAQAAPFSFFEHSL